MGKSLGLVVKAIMVLGLALYINSGNMGYAEGNERGKLSWAEPVFVYGEDIKDGNKKKIKKKLGFVEGAGYKEVALTKKDTDEYTEGREFKKGLHTAVAIRGKDEGKGGVTVKIETPSTITEVTETQVANALITAGAQNIDVVVVSDEEVPGVSILSGVYKAYDHLGISLDPVRVKLAQEEMDILVEVVKDYKEVEGFTGEKLSKLMLEMKTGMVDREKQGIPLTDTNVKRVLDWAYIESELKSVLSDGTKKSIEEYTYKYRDSGVTENEGVVEQLRELNSVVKVDMRAGVDFVGGVLKEKVDEVDFWGGVKNFFTELWDSVKGIFTEKSTGKE